MEADGAQVLVDSPAAYLGVTVYAQGNIVASSGINYYSLQDGNTGNLPDSSPLFWYPLDGDILEIPTTYLEADLGAIQFAQDGDVVTFTHPAYPPMELKRYTDRWTFGPAAFTPRIAAPASLVVTAGGGTSLEYAYVVTALSETSTIRARPFSSRCVRSLMSPHVGARVPTRLQGGREADTARAAASSRPQRVWPRSITKSSSSGRDLPASPRLSTPRVRISHRWSSKVPNRAGS